MKNFISTIIRFSVLTATTMLIFGTTASAQSVLQNTNSNLQQQSGQSQPTTNTQNQVGTLQNNSGNALNESGLKPLGVVSNPNQTAPEATVQPDSTLTAQVNKRESSRNGLWILLIVSVVISSIMGAYLLRSTTTLEPVVQPKPAVRPEPIKVPKKKRAQGGKKKKSRK